MGMAVITPDILIRGKPAILPREDLGNINEVTLKKRLRLIKQV